MDDDLLQAMVGSEENVNKARDSIDYARIRKQFSEKNVQIDALIKGAAEVEATFASSRVFLPSRAFRLSPGTRHRRFVYPHAPFDEIHSSCQECISCTRLFVFAPERETRTINKKIPIRIHARLRLFK